MTDAEAMYENFIVSRRSGRRNAILPVDGKENQEGGSSVSAAVMSHDLAQLHVNKSGVWGFEDAPDCNAIQSRAMRCLGCIDILQSGLLKGTWDGSHAL
ncbi:hypothetical protein N1851_033544 [Merluccius polli]|uniref:Uncharacterized protein n=1 Tax=Merluccius polli TaxID=89951 RepID=A0AA47M157_MERPO|nr:hypothetical protein N1851_033544 [Merluccius polli]